MQSTIPQNNQPIFSAQTFLRRLSQNDSRIPPVVPDGIYGEQTQNAVMEFQKTKNIVPTGILDNETWDELVKEFDCAAFATRFGGGGHKKAAGFRLKELPEWLQ